MPLMEEEVAASEGVLTDLLDKLSDMVRQPMTSNTRNTANGAGQGRVWDMMQAGTDQGPAMHQSLLKESLVSIFFPFYDFRTVLRMGDLPTIAALSSNGRLVTVSFSARLVTVSFSARLVTVSFTSGDSL